jgi:glycosyltransferase involved in cell wall biosynthesis
MGERSGAGNTGRPSRILYTIPNFITAGSGQAMVNVIDRLDRRRFVPTVAVRRMGGELVDHLRESGVDVFQADCTVPEKPYGLLPYRAWRASRPFRGRFDLWHSFDYGDGYTEPLIAYLSGARAWMYTKKNMGWGSRAWQVRSLLARRIAVQNDQMPGLFFDARWLRPKVRYVPTGIDVEAWATAEPDEDIRARLEVDGGAVVVTCVGNVQEGKNQLRIVEALAQVPGAHLLLAGRVFDDDYASHMVDRAAALGIERRVHILGSVDDVAGLLRSSDISVLVSRAEGSPVAMLEAMACGLPGVYSSIPGIEERVTDGHDGFLVGCDDVDLLAERLQQLTASADLRRTMGDAAQQTMLLRGRIEIEAARYETLYLELVGSVRR